MPSENIIRLAVSDTGKGIAPERQSSVFDSFTSGDTRGAKSGSGAGALLRRAARRRRGRRKIGPGRRHHGASATFPETASPKTPRTELELGPEAVAALRSDLTSNLGLTEAPWLQRRGRLRLLLA